MIKKILLIFVLVFNVLGVSAETIRGDYPKDKIIKNKYIQITMPGAVDGVYRFKKTKQSISIYDKTIKNDLAFVINISEKPDNLSETQKIIGTFKDKKDRTYNIVLSKPKYNEDELDKKSPSYKALYRFGEIVQVKYTKHAKEIKL